MNLSNMVWVEVKLLTVANAGFLECSMIAALLKLCLACQCANRYSSSHDNAVHRSIPVSKISKYFLSIHFPPSRLSECGVPWIRVWAGGCSRSMHAFLLSSSASLQSSSEGWCPGLCCRSWTNGSRILSWLIATWSSGSCSADKYSILSLWSLQRLVMYAPM